MLDKVYESVYESVQVGKRDDRRGLGYFFIEFRVVGNNGSGFVAELGMVYHPGDFKLGARVCVEVFK